MYNRQIAKGGLPTPRRNTGLGARRSSRDEPSLLKKVLMSSLLGLAVNAGAGIVLVSVVCFIAYSSPDPLALIPPLSLLALLPANFFGGFISAKRCGESAIACGCITAAMWGALSLIGALCLWNISPSGYSLWQSLLLHAASFGFCLLGAAAGGIKRAPSRKKRRFG